MIKSMDAQLILPDGHEMTLSEAVEYARYGRVGTGYRTGEMMTLSVIRTNDDGGRWLVTVKRHVSKRVARQVRERLAERGVASSVMEEREQQAQQARAASSTSGS